MRKTTIKAGAVAKRPLDLESATKPAYFFGCLWLLSILTAGPGFGADCNNTLLSGTIQDGLTLICSDVEDLTVSAIVHMQCKEGSQIDRVRRSNHSGWWPNEDQAREKVNALEPSAAPSSRSTTLEIEMPVPSTVCSSTLSLGANTSSTPTSFSRFTRILLAPECSPAATEFGYLFAKIRVDCGRPISERVYVSTIRIDHGDPINIPRPSPFAIAIILSPTSGSLNLEPALGFRLPLRSISSSRRWSLELSGSWQSFQLSAAGSELETPPFAGDLFTIDFSLLHRKPLTDRLSLLALGGIGWSFVEGESSAPAALETFPFGITEGEFTPLLGIGLELGWTSRSTFDLRYVWRPVASPLDDSSSSQLQVGLGFRFGH